MTVQKYIQALSLVSNPAHCETKNLGKPNAENPHPQTQLSGSHHKLIEHESDTTFVVYSKSVQPYLRKDKLVPLSTASSTVKC